MRCQDEVNIAVRLMTPGELSLARRSAYNRRANRLEVGP